MDDTNRNSYTGVVQERAYKQLHFVASWDNALGYPFREMLRNNSAR
jgi:hypothetical protein